MKLFSMAMVMVTLVAAALVLPGESWAGGVSVNFGFAAPPVVAYAAPGYYAPAYYAPPPVYAPAVVVYPGYRPYYGGYHHPWHHHRSWGGHRHGHWR